jgi:hypothetical protein
MKCALTTLVMCTALFVAGCATHRPPPGDVRAAECRALWQDELQRPITDQELSECLRRRDDGATIEDWRTFLRTTEEYAARHQPQLPRLHVSGRRGFVTADGQPWLWQGVTGFRLVELVASGRLDDARAFLAWACGPATIVRVFTALDAGMFVLTPADGLAALPRTLELAAAKGCYLEVVALAGTRAAASGLSTREAMGAHVEAVGAICARFTSCAVVELANENSHASQSSDLIDVAFLRALRARVPASVPVSLGSTHGAEDESDIFKDGDFLTIHGDRAAGDDGWRFVRHTNEQRALADRRGIYAVNDEPRRDDLDPEKHFAMAVLCRMFSIGDTFHFGAGLQAAVPTDAELAAFDARARGWRTIPPDWSGGYANAGFPDSPVKGFTNAVRVYSSVNGDQAYTLVLGAQGVQIEWREEWTRRILIASEGGAQVWNVTR